MEASTATTSREAGIAAPGAIALGSARRRAGEGAIKGLLFAAAIISVVTTVGIVLALINETVRFFTNVGLFEFLTGTSWEPLFRPASYGVLPLVGGTLLTTFIALMVAVPLGLASAVYLAEYASQRVRRVLKPVLELLAGVPTIVFGFFAFAFFTPVVLQDLLSLEVSTFNMLSAGIIMGFLILPTVASVAEDAMSAVPAALREGAFGMGATKLQVSTRVVFPAALSGIVASVVLGFARAVGETMILLLAAGQVATLTLDPREPGQTFASYIAASQGGEIVEGSLAYSTLFAAGAMLFILTFIANAISIRFVRKYRQVYE